MKIAVILTMLFLAGACNGLMDALQFHGACKYLDNPGFWCAGESWENKWELDEAGNAIPGQERFWGSSTVFVSLTDGWHLIKFFYLLLLKAAVVLALFWIPLSPKLKTPRTWVFLLAFIVATVAVGSGFFLTYEIIFK